MDGGGERWEDELLAIQIYTDANNIASSHLLITNNIIQVSISSSLCLVPPPIEVILCILDQQEKEDKNKKKVDLKVDQ